MSEKSSVTIGGAPATGVDLLQIMFVGLKLTGHIDWSWWWVLSPIWISACVVIVLAILNRLYERIWNG